MDPHPQPVGGQPPPVTAQVVMPYPLPRPRRSLFGRLLLVLLALVFLGSLALNVLLAGYVGSMLSDSEARVQEKFVSHQRYGHQKVAILSVEGTILEGDGFFRRQIEHAMREAEDGTLKAIVVRVNSPGGTVSGSDYIYHHLRELREKTSVPIVVSMGALAASGGYYVSMAVGDTPKTIYAEPTTWTGSIGVLIPHYDLSELLKKVGVQDDTMLSRPLKGMGSLTRPIGEEERKIFQGLINDTFDRFKDVIKEGRPKFKQDPDALDKIATGQVYTAEQAKNLGLVDEIGFLEAAVDRAIELAKLDKNDVRVVRYKPEPTLASVLFGMRAGRGESLDLAAALDLTAPRAYYLWTSLPPLVSSKGISDL